MIVYGEIQSGRMMLSVAQRQLRQHYLSSLPDGTRFSEEIKAVRDSKTHQQVKTIFGYIIAKVIDEFAKRGWDTSILLRIDKPTGIEVTTNFLKEYFYIVCPMYSEEGQRITLSHKDCDTKAASTFIEHVRNWASSQWSIYIAEPNPDYKKEPDNE